MKRGEDVSDFEWCLLLGPKADNGNLFTLPKGTCLHGVQRSDFFFINKRHESLKRHDRSPKDYEHYATMSFGSQVRKLGWTTIASSSHLDLEADLVAEMFFVPFLRWPKAYLFQVVPLPQSLGNGREPADMTQIKNMCRADGEQVRILRVLVPGQAPDVSDVRVLPLFDLLANLAPMLPREGCLAPA